MGSFQVARPTMQPIEQPDVLGNFQRLQQLQSQQQAQQIQAQEAPYRQQIIEQQAQQGQIATQQQQQGVKDQQAMTAAMQQWDGKSLDDLPGLVLKNGGSSTAVMGLKQKALEMKQTASKIASDDATTGAKNVETLAKKNDMVIGAISSLQSVPDEQLPQALLSQAQQLGQQGLLDPQHVQMAQQLASQPAPAIRAQLDQMTKGMTSFSQALEQAKQQESARHNTAIEANTAAQNANTAAYRQAELKQGAQRLSVEGARLAFQNAQAGIGPGGAPNSLAQAIASGHVTPDRMGYLLSRNPGLIEGVMQVDPSFDSSKAQAYPQVYKDFTSSKNNTAGGALNAGATALAHLKELRDMNTVESHIPGTPDYNAYMNKADTVSSELARFYGNDTIPGIAAIKKTLTATLPGNRDAAIATQAQSMGDKFDSYQQTWDNAAPSKVYQAPMPGISAKAIAARAALDPRFRERMVQEQGNQNPAARGGAPAPQTHIFSLSAWQRANPKGDANAAKAAAQQQGYQVVQ